MANLRENWLKFLREDEVHQIDQASRRVLGDVGVRLEDAELTEKLMDKGCTNCNGRVQLPSEIIDAALARLPREIIFSGRNSEKLYIKEGRVATHTGASIPYLYDLETGQKRDATLADLENLIRLMNQLEHLSMCGAVVMPQDVPVNISEVIQMATVSRLAKKPSLGTAVSNSAQARYVAELYQTLAPAVDKQNEYPFMSIGISPESALYFPKDIVGVMRALISAGIPTIGLVAPILGFTAPMTISGGLIQMNACILAYAVISQEINPSTPVIYGARLAVANMRTASSVWGVPEVGIFGACSVQLVRHYGLPSDVYGYSSTSCAHDTQLGTETSLNGLLPLLAGANIISGFGMFGSGFMSSFEDLVFDNEIFAMHLRVSQGLKVDEDHLAVDVIAEAMSGQEYFLQEHTLEHLRTGELYQPKVGLYGLCKQWEDKGAPDMAEKAREQVKSLLASHEDLPLPDEVEREFKRIITAAEKELHKSATISRACLHGPFEGPTSYPPSSAGRR